MLNEHWNRWKIYARCIACVRASAAVHRRYDVALATARYREQKFPRLGERSVGVLCSGHFPGLATTAVTLVPFFVANTACGRVVTFRVASSAHRFDILVLGGGLPGIEAPNTGSPG